MARIVCPRCGEKDNFHEVNVIVSATYGESHVTYDITDVYCGRCSYQIPESHKIESPEDMGEDFAEDYDALIAFGKRVRIVVEPER